MIEEIRNAILNYVSGKKYIPLSKEDLVAHFSSYYKKEDVVVSQDGKPVLDANGHITPKNSVSPVLNADSYSPTNTEKTDSPSNNKVKLDTVKLSQSSYVYNAKI